ncbi:hypothetical protein FRB91_011148 [Serendipita sp. 411]|nr:hypothetical protein FRC18_010223 [Serendipita sp. 400]KAG8848133.1 hypothetical protein FRB91_011148 [Serendipita sp. 411]
MPPVGYHVYKAKEYNESLQKWLSNPLNGELIAIKGIVPNEAQANLFAQTVKHLFEKSNRFMSFRRSSDLQKIEDIVLRVKEQMIALDAGNEGFLEYSKILQDGMNRLKTLMSPRKLAKLENTEDEAIRQDQQRYESIQRQSSRLPQSDPDTRIQAYFMGDPDKEPYLLPQDRLMTTYNDIMWHLSVHKLVQAPELWARRQDPNVQHCTASGRYWIYVSGDEPISETIFDIVEMAAVSDCYIVALLDNGERERPVPIDIPIFGKRTCCDPSCRSLRVHLESVWTNVRVEHARLFRDERCVLEIPLDSKNFRERKNELYLKVMTRMEEDSGDATIGNPASQ